MPLPPVADMTSDEEPGPQSCLEYACGPIDLRMLPGPDGWPTGKLEPDGLYRGSWEKDLFS